VQGGSGRPCRTGDRTMITRAADAHAAYCEAAKRLHSKRVELAHVIDCATAEVLRAGTILLLRPAPAPFARSRRRPIVCSASY
jgi:hypothetical protein